MGKDKFSVLDAFRGLAALVVVQYHIWNFFGRRIFPHGYLAVDFFFMLSGFVLTHSYQKRLDEGWTMRKFVETRMVRLYPLYFAGLALSALLFAMRVAVHSPQGRNPGNYAWLLLLGVLFIPSPVTIAGYFPFIFPLNPPAWSLFYEMVINVCHARFGRRRPESFLLWIIAVAAAALVGTALHFSSLDVGEMPGQWIAGVARVTFSYALGSFLSRRWQQGRVRLPSWPLLTSALLMGCFAIPATWHKSLVDLVIVLVIFPLILLMGAAAQPARWMVRPSLALGKTSYGIYVLHVPFVALEEQLWFRLRGATAAAEAPWSGLFFLVSTALFVAALDGFYDMPVRRWLKSMLDRESRDLVGMGLADYVLVNEGLLTRTGAVVVSAGPFSSGVMDEDSLQRGETDVATARLGAT